MMVAIYLLVIMDNMKAFNILARYIYLMSSWKFSEGYPG